ncbi:MAG TPA: hypothetical protein VFG81_16405 [Anaerolineales bacterium]|jgi:hypothetical protein|nr:hypothetical protein [Anaerolineales bacterium]
MNSSISQTQGKIISREDRTKLNTLERLLLLLPTAGGLVFGVLPLLLGGAFGSALGFPGNDSFIYRLAGAATFGYAVALLLGLRQGDWAPLRLVVIGTLTFNLASIYACIVHLMAGDQNLFVYLIFGTSIAITAITLWLLNRHPREAQTEADVSVWYIRFLVLGAVLSGAFGLLPLLIPVLGATLTGFRGTDMFLIRQGGAASLGYAVMCLVAIRTGAWKEIRLPLIMALVFNGFSFLASLVALFSGEPVLITVVIAAASLFVTVVGTIAYQRKGQL